jgi:hypothetical protein
VSLMAVGFRESIVRCDTCATGLKSDDRQNPNPGCPTVRTSFQIGFRGNSGRNERNDDGPDAICLGPQSCIGPTLDVVQKADGYGNSNRQEIGVFNGWKTISLK